MARNESQRTIQGLIEIYKQSTTAYYDACDDDDFARQKTAGRRVNQIARDLDSFGVDGRFALIPLLDDADQGIRTFAAADLLKVIPERASAVLEEIRKGPTYFPRLAAGRFLASYADGKWGR